jgi:2-polyprenyl-3-methyl-5-hydroxy-6-metoxy-1,4-benzoquinol methylase
VARAFSHRRRVPELMDQPELAAAEHRRALAGLARINWWSGSAGILWPSIQAAGRTMPRPLRILDVATGAGDVPIRLWQKARRAGLNVEIAACDCSLQALEFASDRAEQAGAEVRFFAWDILQGPPPDRYDVVVSSLFLHHLTEAQAAQMLSDLACVADGEVLINDLRRGTLGWLLAQVGCRTLTSSSVVHYDGPASVAGAFTCAEALTLAETAGLRGATVRRCFPFRYLLRWPRP